MVSCLLDKVQGFGVVDGKGVLFSKNIPNDFKYANNVKTIKRINNSIIYTKYFKTINKIFFEIVYDLSNNKFKFKLYNKEGMLIKIDKNPDFSYMHKYFSGLISE